jgi:PKD repeat protein
MKRKITALLFTGGICLFSNLQAQTHNYAEVLQKSMFFYEAQRSGPLPSDNRVLWRGDSCLNDGQDNDLDLTGGWFDAGDHIKFNLPMSYSVTTLCWGYIENPTAYSSTGQKEYFLSNIKYVTDYLIRCHTEKYVFYGQVGAGNDHNYWIPAEVVELRMSEDDLTRPSYKIDYDNPGTELAGEAAAAFAAAAMVFADEDSEYAALLLSHAKDMYDFMVDAPKGKYSDVITEASAYYNSYSGWEDELVWGAAWLSKAVAAVEGDETLANEYLQDAIDAYDGIEDEEGMSGTKPMGWTLAWDDKAYGCYVLLADLTGDAVYHQDAQTYLDQWFEDRPVSGKGPSFTPSGFPILDQWGSNRYAANTAFLLMKYSDLTDDEDLQAKYYNRGKEIIDYILGSNPQNTSYVIGYGSQYPLYPHHRTAHGSWSRSETLPEETRHILYGALVGGHKTADDDDWTDNRSDYVWNEVATDYNSLFTSAVARLVVEEGGQVLSDFPVEETPSGEFLVEAKINAEGDRFTEASIWPNNRSAWPARVPNLSFRYFIDITEGLAEGYEVSDYEITSRPENHTVSTLLPWDVDNNIYYVEVVMNEDTYVYPGGQGEYREEVQMRVGLPSDASTSAWDSSNDPSYKDLPSTLGETPYITLYADGVLVSGEEPDGEGSIVAKFTYSPSSGYDPLTVSFDGSTSLNPTDEVLTYSWDFDDGNDGEGETIEHTYQEPGTYTPVLTISIPSGETSSASGSVEVLDSNQPPVAEFTATPEIAVAPAEIEFDATASEDPNGTIVSYSWDFGDGSTGTGSVVTHDYDVIGVYTVVLTVTDDDDNVDQASKDITIKEESSCDFGAPMTEPLPSIHSSYSYAHVLGDSGPDLSNVNNFTINWDLSEAGLWQMSFNTSDGSPAWWIDLRQYAEYQFSEAAPTLTLSGVGIDGFDDTYYVVVDGDNFVLVSLTGGFTVYFSNSETPPSCQ